MIDFAYPILARIAHPASIHEAYAIFFAIVFVFVLLPLMLTMFVLATRQPRRPAYRVNLRNRR